MFLLNWMKDRIMGVAVFLTVVLVESQMNLAKRVSSGHCIETK